MNAPLIWNGGVAAEPIDLSHEDVVAHWCRQLDVSEAWLREAVAKVGSMPAAVENYSKTRSGSLGNITEEMRAHQRRLCERSAARRAEARATIVT